MFFPERANLHEISDHNLNPVEWGLKNKLKVKSAIRYIRDRAIEEAKWGNNQRLISILSLGREESEMGACRALEQLIEDGIALPEGFGKVIGSVTILFNGTPLPPVEHVFYRQKGNTFGSDIIMCFTAAQFMADGTKISSEFIKGDKIRILEENAVKAGLSGLVHNYGDGIVLLCGTRDQIWHTFGLLYDDSFEGSDLR